MLSSMRFRAERWFHRCGSLVLLSLVGCADDMPLAPTSRPQPTAPASPVPRPAPPAVPGAAKLDLSRNDIVFNAMVGATLSDTASITVSGPSPEVLSDLRAIVRYSAQRQDWLEVAIDHASPSTTLSVRARSTPLPPGEYVATVRLAAPGAAPESLSVTAHVATGGGIGLNAAKICFTPTFSGPDARPDDVRITSLDGSPLDGLSAAVIYDPGQPTGWLSTAFTAPSAPARLWLTSNKGAMPPGQYHATVEVSSTTPGVAPVSIRVTLEIRPLKSATLTLSLATVGLGGAGNGRLTAPGIDCVLTNGVQGGDCEESYVSGTVVHVTAIPAAGQVFYGQGSNLPGSNAAGFDVDMTYDYSFQGGFGAPASTLVVNIRWEGPGNSGMAFVDGPHGLRCEGGGCSAMLDGGVGDFGPIAAYGEYGAVFVRFEGACSGHSCNVHFDTPGTTKEVTAVFRTRPSQIGPFFLQGTGASGTVSFSAPVTVPGSSTPLTCRIVNGVPAGPCQGIIDAGVGTFTVTATPDPGSVFVWWTLGGSGAKGDVGARCRETSPTCTLAVTVGGTLVDGIVTFAPASWHSLQVQVEGSGSVGWPDFNRCPGEAFSICKEYFEPGSTVTLTARPGEGATFLGWTDCTAPSGATCDMLMTGNRRVIARFGP